MLPGNPIENFEEISGRFLKALEYEGFNFIYIETNNIYQVSSALADLVKEKYSSRKFLTLYFYNNTYRWLMDQIEEMSHGIIFINDFEQIIQNPEIAVPFNQRRDKLAAMPISLVCFAEVGAMPKVARAIPDLWSFRNLVLTLRYLTPLPTEKLLNREQITAVFIDENTKKEKLELINQLNGKISTLNNDLYDYPLKSRLLHELSGLYADILLFDQAIETEKTNFALARQFNMNDNVEFARIDFNIGNFSYQQADYEASKTHLTKALGFAQKTKDNLLLAECYDGLGSVYRQTGNYTSSLEYALKSVEIYKKTLSSDHPDLASSYDKLSAIYLELGNLDLALDIQLIATKIREKVLGADVPEMANSYDNLSTIYLANGNLQHALDFQLKAFGIRKKVLSPDHPSMSQSYNNLGVIYQDMGNIPKAIDFQLKAIEICKKVLSPNHPWLATSYSNLSLIYQAMSNLPQAIDFQLKAKEIREKVLSPDHPDLAASYNNLCSIYYDMKEFDKAEFYIKKAVEIYKKALPKEHPSIQNALDWQKLVEDALPKS